MLDSHLYIHLYIHITTMCVSTMHIMTYHQHAMPSLRPPAVLQPLGFGSAASSSSASPWATPLGSTGATLGSPAATRAAAHPGAGDRDVYGI